MDGTAVAPLDRPLGPMAQRSLGWWGVALAIATEATLFGLLLFAWFYLWVRADSWPLGGIEKPRLLEVSIRTVLLLGSSIPAQLAVRAIEQGRQRRFVALLSTTWAMAAIFLIGHAMETADDWDRFRPSTNAYGSLWYTITNLHALHLVVGLSFLAFLAVGGMRGRYGPGRTNAVEVVVLYWHFVDVVWVAVFSSLYLAVALS